jgi:hypothetical protein
MRPDSFARAHTEERQLKFDQSLADALNEFPSQELST